MQTTTETTETPTRGSDTATVARWAAALGLPAVIVGRWVWVFFESKPGADVRAQLKAAGFRWVKVRAGWAHCCGHPSKRGSGDPRDKYGAVPVQSAV